MKSLFNSLYNFVSAIVMITAIFIFISRYFFYKDLLKLTPNFFRDVTSIDLETSPKLKFMVHAYNGAIDYVNIYSRGFLIILFTFLLIVLLYDFVSWLKDIKISNFFLAAKTLAVGISITSIIVHTSLVVATATKYSNDIFTNLYFFTVVVSKSVAEKKELFINTFYQTINDSSNELLTPEMKIKLIQEFNINKFIYLTDDYIDKSSTQTLHDLAVKEANGLLDSTTQSLELTNSLINSGNSFLILVKKILVVGATAVEKSLSFAVTHPYLTTALLVGIGFSIYKLGGFNERSAVLHQETAEAGIVVTNAVEKSLSGVNSAGSGIEATQEQITTITGIVKNNETSLNSVIGSVNELRNNNAIQTDSIAGIRTDFNRLDAFVRESERDSSVFSDLAQNQLANISQRLDTAEAGLIILQDQASKGQQVLQGILEIVQPNDPNKVELLLSILI